MYSVVILSILCSLRAIFVHCLFFDVKITTDTTTTMAEAATSFDIKDLMQCGICLMDLQLPKALPCLHSFCLKCLSQWAKGKTSVTCPLCVQEFDIPSGGVSSFRTNFFINTLREQSETMQTIKSKDAMALCANCDLLETNIEGHCTGCKGFICVDCVSIHAKLKHLKDHKITSYADLQAGKVNIKNIYKKKHCKIHEDQVLKFYCETCEELVCLECTVVDHAATSHTLVNLESAARGQKTEIEQLLKNCKDVKKKIDGSLENVDVLSELLTTNTQTAEADIDEAFHKAEKMLENSRNKLKDELKTISLERKTLIRAEKDPIQLEQTRFVTAMQMATELLQKGSDYDMAQVYSSLKSNLTTLCNLKPRRMNKTLGDVSFKPTPTSQRVDYNLGSISTCHRGVKKGIGVWKIHKSFGDTGNDKLSCARDIAITQQSDIIVTDFQPGAIKSYEAKGTLKSKTTTTNAWNIKLSRDGRVFVTNCRKTINVYNQEMTFQQQFPAKSPGGVSSDSCNTNLRGLALDNNNMLLVGECNQKYISKHRLDGSHVMSFKVSIQPWYISVSSQDKVIVSSPWRERAVHILNEQGNHLHTVKPPPGLSSWNPGGVCCTAYDEVYITNSESPGSIHIYSAESGAYIGCLTKDVTYPAGLALMDDEDRLVVVEENGIKILQREE